MRKSIWSVLLLPAVLSACASVPDLQSYGASLNSANEVPAVTTPSGGTGSVTAVLNGTTLSVIGRYAGLTGAATMAHIHGPASKTTAADILFMLTYTNDITAGSGTLTGSFALTAAQVADLRAGKYYVNVHTSANPKGEVRGQLELK